MVFQQCRSYVPVCFYASDLLLWFSYLIMDRS